MSVEFAIKVRWPTKKQWSFLASNGGTNSLIVHALRFSLKDAAQAVIDQNAPNNEGVEWKIVPIGKGPP